MFYTAGSTYVPMSPDRNTLTALPAELDEQLRLWELHTQDSLCSTRFRVVLGPLKIRSILNQPPTSEDKPKVSPK